MAFQQIENVVKTAFSRSMYFRASFENAISNVSKALMLTEVNVLKSVNQKVI